MCYRFLILFSFLFSCQFAIGSSPDSAFTSATNLSLTQPKRAMGVFKDILNSNLRSNDSIKFLTHLEISDYYRDEAIMDSALHYAISANLFANEKKRRDWAALSLLRIAKLYRGFELFEKAEDQLELVEAQISLAEYPDIWCQYLKSKALTEFEKGNNEACYLLMDSAIALAAEIGDSTMQEAFIMDKAMRYYGQGDLDNCMSIYDSLLSQDINLKLETTILHNVITIYLEQDQIQEADYMSQAFLELANESDKLDYIIQATYDRIMVLEEMGIYDEALNLYYDLDEMEDSLYTTQLSNALSDMQMRFDVAKKESELEVARSELEVNTIQQRSLIAAIAGLAILIIVGLWLFKQRLQNRELAAEKEKREKELFEVRNIELKSAFDEIEYKNQEITASIKYAKRIQKAILPSDRILSEVLPNSFVLYKPKDIVAGDFYWLETHDDWIYFAAADCTGHGVPGAMVSVICNNGLNRSVREFGFRDPNDILGKTRDLVIQEFEKSEETVKDGMDISLYALHKESKTIKWSGANNPLCVVKANQELDNRIIEMKADKQPIGEFGAGRPFTQHELVLEDGDMIYSYSDGYPDQFGGDNGKKFKSVNFKKLLVSIADQSLSDQKEILDTTFEKWRGELEQIDDVCVFGVRV